MKNEIFVCRAHVVFDQDGVFFRTLSKSMKNRGGREGDRGEKNVIFFPKRGEFEGLPEEKKVHFSVIRGSVAGSGRDWSICSILRISLFCGREATA